MAQIASQTLTMQSRDAAERQAILDKQKADSIRVEADAERYRLEQIAHGNEQLYSNPNYINALVLNATQSNAKLILGNLPQNSLSFLNLQDSAGFPTTCGSP